MKGVIAYKGGVSPLAAIEDTERDLENLEWDNRSDYYPEPRPLTPEEHACLEWRTAIASEASHEIYVNLGHPTDRPQDSDGTQEPWRTWEDVSSFLVKWGNEPAYNANRHIKMKRWRRRPMLVKYRQEVSAFCERWRLKAWRAVPALIQYHFLRAEYESTWDPSIPPLSMYGYDPGPPVTLLLMVKLPGRTVEQFKRDEARALSLVEITMIQASRGPIRVVRSHLTREERADWEKSVDSSCVTLEWDGHPYLPQSILLRTANDEGSPRRVTPGDYLVDQCQERVGRRLKYKEKRDVKSQVAAQLQEYRVTLGREGWSPLSDGNRDLIASRVARILLVPTVTWSRLTPADERGKGKNRYGDFQSIQRACKNFAALAKLDLPKKRRGRVQGSRNTFDSAHR
ncbi:MAG: hypothetical protein J4N93_05880 [Chloroflexi bacterium]|nr:hypothetical protein [Chloroflexota bacterium]